MVSYQHSDRRRALAFSQNVQNVCIVAACVGNVVWRAGKIILHKLLNMASGKATFIFPETIAGLSDIPRLEDDSFDGDREHSEVHTKLSSCFRDLP